MEKTFDWRDVVVNETKHLETLHFTSCTIKSNGSSEVPLKCPKTKSNCSHFSWPSFWECTQYVVSGWMYITDVKSSFIFPDHPNVKHFHLCLNRPDWQNLKTPLMWLCMSQRVCYQAQKLADCSFSLHIQAVSTWEDHFGPNDMAWQQNNPKGTWGSFLESGPNYNMGQKN